MATNEILRFAETDTGTNLLTQSEYASDSQRQIGNQPGVARSKLVNKALRQSSLIAAGVAEFLADKQANNITDALTPQNIADYLQAAITGAPVVTPPQFDNDTSLATTEFVQQAIGNLRSFQVFTASGTLDSSSVGRITQLATASKLTVTMPKANTVPSGSALTLVVSGNQSATLAVQSGDGFALFSRPELMHGESIVLVSNGVNSWWRATGSESEAPPGTVIYVARNSVPFGYLKANGAAISRSTYSRLFAEIGTTFGEGDGSTTFALPDLRGEFVRGWDDARGVDSGRNLGSSQADELKSHTHAVNGQWGSNWSGENAYNWGIGQIPKGWETDKIQATGGTETRPRNIALLACIKY